MIGMTKRKNVIFPKNREHQQSYCRIEGREIGATRWKDSACLASFQFLDDFAYLAQNAGMARFAALSMNTYRDLSLEFLASLHDTVGTYDGKPATISSF